MLDPRLDFTTLRKVGVPRFTDGRDQIQLQTLVRMLCYICSFGSREHIEEIVGMRPLSAIISVAQSMDEEQETDLEVIEQGLRIIAQLFVQQSGLLTDGRPFFDDDEIS